ncbi:hypothetical protein LBMAG53_17200 [Planctomycetota bacterium]|nr:hypothetical protein LBMAG53_17200 [Planctomycetota bacterium]
MTADGIPREGQRPDPTTAQGNALGTQPGLKPSPERATQPPSHDWIAPSGLTQCIIVIPGRCPGLSWVGPLALSTGHSQGQRPEQIQPRATPWVISTALISAAVTGQIDVRHLAEASVATVSKLETVEAGHLP